MAHVTCHGQNCRASVEFDRGTPRLDPEPGARAVYHLNFEPSRHILPLQAPGHGLAEKRTVGGFDEIDDVSTYELRGFETDQGCCRVVREQDLFIMDQDDFGQRTRKIPEKPVASLDLLVALAERIEQPVDGESEIGHIAMLTGAEPVTNRGISRYLEHLLTESPDPCLQAAPGNQGKSGHRDCRNEQQRQDGQD